MREIRTSGSVGAAGGNSRGDPTARTEPPPHATPNTPSLFSLASGATE